MAGLRIFRRRTRSGKHTKMLRPAKPRTTGTPVGRPQYRYDFLTRTSWGLLLGETTETNTYLHIQTALKTYGQRDNYLTHYCYVEKLH